MSCGIAIWIGNTNVFHCAGNKEVFQKLKQWREDGRINSGTEKLESYKEWNWSYGWNALGEIEPRYRELSLGTVPAQENPVTVNKRSSLSFADPDYGYKSLKESEIVVPSNMFIIADRSGWIQYDNGYPAVFVGEASLVDGQRTLSRRHGKNGNITFMGRACGVVESGADFVAVKGSGAPLESNQRGH